MVDSLVLAVLYRRYSGFSTPQTAAAIQPAYFPRSAADSSSVASVAVVHNYTGATVAVSSAPTITTSLSTAGNAPTDAVTAAPVVTTPVMRNSWTSRPSSASRARAASSTAGIGTLDTGRGGDKDGDSPRCDIQLADEDDDDDGAAGGQSGSAAAGVKLSVQQSTTVSSVTVASVSAGGDAGASKPAMSEEEAKQALREKEHALRLELKAFVSSADFNGHSTTDFYGFGKVSVAE